jgi:hypothetical protein
MRVFVSSSFEDLREHRAAAIRVLRQLGHEVLAMEDMTAGSVAPLQKVLDMVNRSDAYVGVFAWRYGYVPKAVSPPAAVQVEGATAGATSITHYEYLRAKERGIPILAFLLDESCAWPPRLIDGFDPADANGPTSTNCIRGLRFALQQERVVSWFTTPSDLEARVSAAITTAGLTQQLDLQDTTALDPATGVPGDTSAEAGIADTIRNAGDSRALKIDLRTEWWSTRLYLIAALAERLTGVRRVLIVDSRPPDQQNAPYTVPPSPANPDASETFVGQLATITILSTIRSKTPAIETFEAWLRDRSPAFNELDREIAELLQGWRDAFKDMLGQHVHEGAARSTLSAGLLRRWFGEAMLRGPIRLADLERASVVDLLRLLDYPGDFVPVVTRRQRSSLTAPVADRVTVMDKAAVNARLARNYLVELMDRARIS